MKKFILTIFITIFSILLSFGQNIAELKQKAEQGDAWAQYNLGVCYANGDGVKKDFSEAVKWYRKAAEQGYAKAQYNLGVCYAVGNGVIQNNVKAYAWLLLALENGFENAKKAMDILEEKMTQAELDKALKLIENYRNGKFD